MTKIEPKSFMPANEEKIKALSLELMQVVEGIDIFLVIPAGVHLIYHSIFILPAEQRAKAADFALQLVRAALEQNSESWRTLGEAARKVQDTLN